MLLFAGPRVAVCRAVPREVAGRAPRRDSAQSSVPVETGAEGDAGRVGLKT